MSESRVPAAGVTDTDLAGAIEASTAATVLSLARRPWEYTTSAPLEIITATVAGGGTIDLVLKHLSPRAQSKAARRAKPSFVLDPQREIEVYRRLLAPLHIGPRLFGSAIRPDSETYWLLTEQVQGREMYQVGEMEAWSAVARWLAGFHRRGMAVDGEAVRRSARLIEYDREWYSRWMERALFFFAVEDPASSRRDRMALRWLADRYDRVIDRLMLLPLTIIHGEFYPSNILLADRTGPPTVCPIDWEMAACGPGVIDLAALTLGHWREADRRLVISSYLAASDPRGRAGLVEMVEAVDFAQIHLSVQWLGWFGRRRAPAEHTRDWLSDAIERTEALRL